MIGMNTERELGKSMLAAGLDDIYSSKHKDQINVKKKSKCEITFYFKAS